MPQKLRINEEQDHYYWKLTDDTVEKMDEVAPGVILHMTENGTVAGIKIAKEAHEKQDEHNEEK